MVIINVDDTLPLPYMGDDGSNITSTLRIPSMMIQHSVGVNLVQNGASVKSTLPLVQLSWGFPSSSEVSYTLFTSVTDVLSSQFKTNFPAAVTVLGSLIRFDPHYAVRNAWDFSTDDDQMCTNERRYCPFTSPNAPVTGRMMLEETVRQVCVFRYANSSSNPGQPTLWWSYVSQFSAQCSASFAPTCSDALMTSLSIDTQAVRACMDEAGGLDAAEGNSVLEAEKQLTDHVQLLSVPTLLVNGELFAGSLRCPSPITIESCNPLQAVCAGFPVGTAPAACSPSKCPFGVLTDQCGTCGGSNACLTSNSSGGGGVSWTLVGVLLSLFLLAGGLAFWLYTKRQRRIAQMEIDDIIAHYLPVAAEQARRQQQLQHGAAHEATASSSSLSASNDDAHLDSLEVPLHDIDGDSSERDGAKAQRADISRLSSAIGSALKKKEASRPAATATFSQAPDPRPSASREFTLVDDEHDDGL